MNIGVSPAYFISKYGEDFSPDDIIHELPILQKMGFNAIQLEITKQEYLEQWDSDLIEKLSLRCNACSIDVSQVVAHHWITTFTSAEALSYGLIIDEIENFLQIASQLPNCKKLTVPLGRFIPDKLAIAKYGYTVIKKNLEEIFSDLCNRGSQKGISIVLELQPGSLIQGAAGFLRFLNEIGNPINLKYNLDTGHVNATREIVELYPALLGDLIAGTHLCDNDSKENLSLTPGKGNLNWGNILSALKSINYQGSYDLEIICPSTQVKEEYEIGYKYLMEFLDKS